VVTNLSKESVNGATKSSGLPTGATKNFAKIATIVRVAAKTLVLFVVINAVYIVINPLPALSQLTVHNTLLPGRSRFQAVLSNDAGYGRSTTNIDLMLAAHEIAAGPKPVDEYRVLLMGDSSVWGYLLGDHETLSENINRRNLVTTTGQRVRAYNLALPGMYATKDLLLMTHVNQFQPDLVVWFVTLEMLGQSTQKDSFFVCSNMAQLRPVLERYHIGDIGCPFEPSTSILRRSIWGQRRDLATLVFSQMDGLLWAATGIDHQVTRRNTLTRHLIGETEWRGHKGPTLDDGILILNALDAAKGLVDAPLLVVNEPVLTLNGINTSKLYNRYMPRWAYDHYMQLLETRTQSSGIRYANLWDVVTADQFTDNEVHYTSKAVNEVADRVGQEILKVEGSITANP
jgi:hypothetical protein